MTTKQEKELKKEERMIRSLETNTNLRSKSYMGIFYMIAILTLTAMTLQFFQIENLKISVECNNTGTVIKEVNTEYVLELNDKIPYEVLIYAMIAYCLSMFGIEGTRSIIASMDIKNICEKAKNMPRYKQRRLMQMIFTFFVLSIFGVVYTTLGNITKANYHLKELFIGLSLFMSILAYANMGPKLSNEIKRKQMNDEEMRNEKKNCSTTDETIVGK